MSWPDWADRLPEYRSHKIVRAAPIASFDGLALDGKTEIVSLVVGRDAGRTIRVALPPGIFARGPRAAISDFIVVYDDGYVSWSPRLAFEAGYAREG